VNGVRFALCDLRPMDILRGGPTVTLHVESFNHVSAGLDGRMEIGVLIGVL
jgi:hypothetical protein